MTVAPIATTPNPATSKAEASRTTLAGDVESFLKLLTTQLQHQDPLAPMDSTQFTAQLAQFAAVEQSIQTNSNLESLIGLSKATQTATAVSYLGKTAEANGATNALVDGRAEYKYTLDKTAAATTIVIRNAADQIVYSAQGKTTPGEHSFVWDGKGSDGASMPAGAYTVAVTAVDPTGASKTAQTKVVGRIDGADTSGQDVALMIGPVRIPLDSVVSLRNPQLP